MKNTFRILSILVLFIVCNTGLAQSSLEHQSVLYVDAIVNYEGKIKVRNSILELNKVEAYTRNYVRKQPAFKFDQVVYRVYADENLELGTIMDLEQELQKAFEGKRERYLLNTKRISLDETDMWENLKSLKIKAVTN